MALFLDNTKENFIFYDINNLPYLVCKRENVFWLCGYNKNLRPGQRWVSLKKITQKELWVYSEQPTPHPSEPCLLEHIYF